jgi:hypothetical protein
MAPTPFEHELLAEAIYGTGPCKVAPLAGLEIVTPAKAAGIMAHTHTIKKAYFDMQSDPPKDFGFADLSSFHLRATLNV